MERAHPYTLMGGAPVATVASLSRRLVAVSAFVAIIASTLAIISIVKVHDMQGNVNRLEEAELAASQQADVHAVSEQATHVATILSTSPLCHKDVSSWASCTNAAETARSLMHEHHNSTHTDLSADVMVGNKIAGDTEVVVSDHNGIVVSASPGSSAIVGQPHKFADKSKISACIGEHVCAYEHDGRIVVMTGDLFNKRQRRCWCLIGNCCNSGGTNSMGNDNSVSLIPK
eukprot:m.477273 g.477273  ORF g.477273 m.477273 type:complete len:230 (+) comp20799_c0_seq1:1041-1730(+)